MPDSLTLKALNDLFADHDGVVDADERKGQLRQMRSIIQAGIVFPDKPVSQGETAVFSVERAAQLRVLQTLLDIGIKGPVLARFAARLTATPDVRTGGNHPGTAIAMAVEGTRAGENWILNVLISRHRDTGAIDYLGGLHRADEERNPISDQIQMAGRVFYATVTLPVSDLIAPILQAMEAE